MRHPQRLTPLTLFCLLLTLACSLPRFSSQEVRQQIIRVLDEKSDEELVLDYIIVTPPTTPTATFTPTLTPTLQPAAGGPSSAAGTGEAAPAGDMPSDGVGGESPISEETSIATVPSPVIPEFTPTPLPATVTPLPVVTALPTVTPPPATVGVPTASPVPPTSPPPTSPPPDDGGSDPSPVRVSFKQATFAVDEYINTLTVDVVLSAPSIQPITVNYTSSDGSATAGSDYQAVNGTLVFAPSQTVQSFSLPLMDDSLADELDETINLSLSNPAQATLGLATAVVTILDDDPLIHFSSAAYQVSEGDGTAAMIVVLDTVSSLPVRVTYASSNGSATAGSDYTAVTGTLTVPPGLTSNSFVVPVTEDAVLEPDETLNLTLSNPVNGRLGLAAATLTIEDNDVLVQFSSATYTILENEGVAVITVTLATPSPRAVRVLYTSSDGTATAGDYFASAGSLTIPAGSTGGTFTVPVIDDPLIEVPETVILTLDASVNATLGGTRIATLTIISDDNNPIVNTTDDGDDGLCEAGHCSLREAIRAANSSPGLDTIAFDIAGTGPHTITPGSPLPAITGPVTLDGLTQPGAACNNLLIELRGSSAGAGANGLELSAGPSSIQGLVINRFSGHGITIDATGNIVRCNYIGTDPTGLANAGNGRRGISLGNMASGTTIGGSSENLVAYNGGAGVWVAAASPGNRIMGNRIFANGGLGIDLEPGGVTPNDPGDNDTGANHLQNFPVLSGVTSLGVNTRVTGKLNSFPSSNYTLEFFANSSCDGTNNGEGEIVIGTQNQMTDNNGDLSFSIILHVNLPPGQFITATATDALGNTSEFSACQVVN